MLFGDTDPVEDHLRVHLRRAAIDDPIHITIAGHPGDPRSPAAALPGIVIHDVPELHPEDCDVVRGLPVVEQPGT